MRWLRANAARFHLDANRIGVFGTSAGGYLASVLGTSNPIAYIDRADPPFLIMQGKQDCLTPWQQAQELYDALHAAGVAARLVYLPTAQHADDQFNSPANQAIVDDFLDRNLMGARRRAATPAPAAPPSSSRSAGPPSR